MQKQTGTTMNGNSSGRMGRRYVRTVYLVCVLTAFAAASASAAGLTYVYDDLGRLSQVIDAQGNVATYTYDAVGNILSIDRGAGDCPVGPPTVTSITFDACSQGASCQITIDGSGLLGASVSADNPLATVSRCRGDCSQLTCSLDASTTFPPGSVGLILATPLAAR